MAEWIELEGNPRKGINSEQDDCWFYASVENGEVVDVTGMYGHYPPVRRNSDNRDYRERFVEKYGPVEALLQKSKDWSAYVELE